MSDLKKSYRRLALMVPVLLAVVVFAAGDLLPPEPNASDILLVTWFALCGVAEAFILALKNSTEAFHQLPPGAYRLHYLHKGVDTVCGTVIVGQETFRGPDGRDCVAALRILGAPSQNRSVPFWISTGRHRILVKLAPEVVSLVVAESWRRAALRPRWFAGGAWAPELAAGERLDWVCVREGDLVKLEFDRMRWANGVEPELEGETAADEGSPYRIDGRDLEVELDVPDQEGNALVTVLHPTNEVAWARRLMLRIAGIFAAIVSGIMFWGWAWYASDILGGMHPASLLLLLAGAAMFIVPIAAWFAFGFVRAWSSNVPPPWMPGGKVEVLVDSPAQSWVELASRFPFFLMGSAALVFVSVSAGIFGFNGLLFGGGAIMVAGFLYAMFGSPQRE